LSSVHEGFGIVIREAMQVGLPIISTDNGGQVDLVKEKKNGYLIKFGDINKFTENLNTLKRNNKLAQDISIFNKEEIKKFKHNNICREYTRVLK
jgi:glycosyltransferase involved in cell wall biosynthesis